MSIKIETFFGAMQMQSTWTEFLTAHSRSFAEFTETFNLKTSVDLAPITDVQILASTKTTHRLRSR